MECKLKNIKLRKLGNGTAFLIPKAFSEHGELEVERFYDIIIVEKETFKKDQDSNHVVTSPLLSMIMPLISNPNQLLISTNIYQIGNWGVV